MAKIRALLVVGMLSFVGGCSDDGTSPEPGQDPVADVPTDRNPPTQVDAALPIRDIDWELTDYRTNDGEDVVATFAQPYRLTLLSDQSARTATFVSFPTCGRLEGDYRLEGTTLTMEDGGDVSAVISCDGSPDGDARTDAFLIDLFTGTQTLSADLADDVLTLTSASGARARFANGDRSVVGSNPDDSSSAGCVPSPVWLTGDRLSYRYIDRVGMTTDIEILFSDVDDRRALLDVTEGRAVYRAAFQVGCNDTQGDSDPTPSEVPSAALQQLFAQFEDNAFLRRALRGERPRFDDEFVLTSDSTCGQPPEAAQIDGVPGETTTCMLRFEAAMTNGLLEFRSSTFTGDRDNPLQINVSQVERYDGGDTTSLTLQSADLQPAPFPFERIAFEELRTGDLSSLGNEVLAQPRLQVLRDQDSLSTLYTSLVNCGPCTGPGPPEADFTDSIVVFVAHEIETFTGVGIEVADVWLTRRSNGVTVDAVAVDVLQTEPGEGCPVDDAPSGPFAFYTLRTRVEPVNIFERTEYEPACRS